MRYSNSNELKHYGVLGMKWGVRKNPAKAYVKAVRKKTKLLNKSEKLNLKSSKKMKKGMRLVNRSTIRPKRIKGFNLLERASDLSLESAKLRKKGNKWAKEMDKVFSTYEIKKIPNGNVTAGKNFIYRSLYGDDSYEVKKRSASD